MIFIFNRAFHIVEAISPFHEFLNDRGSFVPAAAASQATTGGERVLTKAELKEYDGSVDGKGPYLAVLGQVFDVSKGKDHYGPGGGYSFFSGADGSRAFVTGEFNEAGLVDDVTGLSHQDYLGLQEWLEFYHKDYSYVGKLEGKFYDAEGKATAYKDEVRFIYYYKVI